MTFQKGSKALILLLAALTAVGPISTDMYLPSLPAIGIAFDVSDSMVQLTLSAFIIGFAIGQIFYGPLSDRFGRKRVLSAGLVLYVAGSVACLISSNIELLIALCLAFGGLFVLISASSFVLQNHFGLSEIGFGLSFSICVAGYIVGTLIGARLTHSKTVEYITFMGSGLLAISGLAMISLSFIDQQKVWHFLLPMFFSMAGIGLVMPQSMAGALTPFANMAGAASSLIGFVQNVVAALFGIVATYFVGFNPNALVWIIGITGIANFLLSVAYKKKWLFSSKE